MSISNEDGDSLRIVQLSDTPSDLHFAKPRNGEFAEENLLSLILGRKVLFLFNLSEPDAPIELGFQQHYGDIQRHIWFGQGNIVLAFSQGYIITISTNPRELGQEMSQLRVHSDCLTDLDINEESGISVSCGQEVVKIQPLKGDSGNVKTLSGNEEIESVRLSNDGQLLAISTVQGGFCIFVTQLSSLYAVQAPRVAVLTNLSEVSIYHFDPEKQGYRNKLQRPVVVTLELEPDFISVGPSHLACGLNNHVIFYDLGKEDRVIQMGSKEFHAQISNIKINETLCSVLCGGQVVLQPIESQPLMKRDPQMFPDSVPGMAHAVITSHELTKHFLLMGTDVSKFLISTFTI